MTASKTIESSAHSKLRTLGELKVSGDVRGVVVRSGKTTGFCVGADLGELGVAYEMAA